MPRPATAAPSADIAALARGGRTNLVGFFLRLGARVPFLFIGGRAAVYGAEALGRFASALVVVELVAMLCTLGEKRGLAQRLAESDARASPANIVADGVLVALTVSCGAALILWLFPAPMFPSGHYTAIDRLLVVAIPPLALTEIWLAALAYRFNVAATVSARAIVEPWTLSLVAAAMIFVAPVSGLAIAYIASIYAAAVASLVPYLRLYGRTRGWRPRLPQMARLAWHSLPLAGADAIEWGTRRLDILILGFFTGPGAVGVYYVAQQIASLPQKLKTSFEPVLGPVLTQNIKDGDMAAIARQVCQVGFWITAAQVGIALALAIPGTAVMGLFGPRFVGGTGALALLLAAEVVASPAVVSEAALIYLARLRNLALSVATVVVQAALTLAGMALARWLGLSDLFRAAAAALALFVALGLTSLAKARLLATVIGARVTSWRWALAWAGLPALVVGLAAVWLLPEWATLALGVPMILAVYGWIIWTRGFGAEDRVLFGGRAPA